MFQLKFFGNNADENIYSNGNGKSMDKVSVTPPNGMVKVNKLCSWKEVIYKALCACSYESVKKRCRNFQLRMERIVNHKAFETFIILMVFLSSVALVSIKKFFFCINV